MPQTTEQAHTPIKMDAAAHRATSKSASPKRPLLSLPVPQAAAIIASMQLDKAHEAFVRMTRNPDDEALHDFRVGLRQLRSTFSAYPEAFPSRPGDEKDSQGIKNGIIPKPILAPKSSFGQMSALIKRCNLVIANDSGPMHVSAALGIPTLGIFGPTDPAAHRPYSENSGYVIHSELYCIKCNKLHCPYGHECMLELSTEKVLIEVSKLLKN